MPKPFTGINPYIDSSAIARGHDPARASPRALLVSAAKAEKLMAKAGDAIGQASTARPEHKAEIVGRAIEILWKLAVMKEAVEAALLDFHADHELDVSELMKVIEHGTRYGGGDGDRRVGDDVEPAQGRRPAGGPRQARDDQRRKG